MWENAEFAIRCIENASPEQIVMWAANIAILIAGHFGYKLSRKVVLGIGAMTMVAVKAAGWCLSKPEGEPDAADAATQALDDENILFEGGYLSTDSIAVGFRRNDSGRPASVSTAYVAGGKVSLQQLLTPKQWKRFCSKAMVKVGSVIERDRKIANRAAAAAMLKNATIEQVSALNQTGWLPTANRV